MDTYIYSKCEEGVDIHKAYPLVPSVMLFTKTISSFLILGDVLSPNIVKVKSALRLVWGILLFPLGINFLDSSFKNHDIFRSCGIRTETHYT